MNEYTLWGFIMTGIVLIIILNLFIASYLSDKYDIDPSIFFSALLLIEIIATLFILGAILP